VACGTAGAAESREGVDPSQRQTGAAAAEPVYHFMFGPDYTAGCPACSAIADGFNGFTVHLANHEKPVLSDGHIRRSAP